MQELFIDSVTHKFNQQTILNGVFINCKIGEVVGLLGRNGSGKSTLLKIIFGSTAADFKFLKINEKIIDKGYRSGEISYLPQDNFVPNNVKLTQAIDIFCNQHKEELLKIRFVTDHLQRKFRTFSGGESRFLECLLMIYSDTKFVLLDEPFSQLAPLLIEELKLHINFAKQFKSFIITDHYHRSIIDVSDRIVLLHNGCNYKIESVDDLILHGYLPHTKN